MSPERPEPATGGEDSRCSRVRLVAALGVAAFAGTVHALAAAGSVPVEVLPVAWVAWLSALLQREAGARCGAAYGVGFMVPFVPALYSAARATLGLSGIAALGLVVALVATRVLAWGAFGALAGRLPRKASAGLVLAVGCGAAELLIRCACHGLAVGELTTALVGTRYALLPTWLALGILVWGAWWVTLLAGTLSTHTRWWVSAAALASVAGLVVLPGGAASESSLPLRVLVVGADLPQVAAQHPRLALQRYLELTHHALQQSGVEVDLVVWPEGALALDLEHDAGLRTQIGDALRTAGQAPHLLLGCEGVSPETGALQNAALLLNPTGRVVGRYARRHLLPFGEYTPSWTGGVFSRRGGSEYAPGARDCPPLELKRPGRETLRLRVVLCGEGLEPSLVADGDPGDLIVVLANDGVFPEGGLLKALLDRSTNRRAIERGVPLLRVSNHGPSSFSSPAGALLPLRNVGDAHAVLLDLSPENDASN